MDTEMMIRELKRVEEKHKHDKVFTGQLDVAQMAHDTRKRLEELKPYEDTGLDPEQIRELKEAVHRLDKIFGDEITVNQVIDFFLDFYIANGDPGRVAAAELLTNEEVARYRSLKERDTAKPLMECHYEEPGEEPYIKYTCPNGCKIQPSRRSKFCGLCGQRLKWED